MSTSTAIEPLAGPLTGELRVPGDKSISHRSVLFAAMAQGTSNVEGVLDSADVRSSLAAVRALGAEVDIAEQPDGSLAGSITGWGKRGPAQPEEPIDCGNSGTTVRLLMGVLAPWDITVQLTGDESLQRRPMARITKPLTSMGAMFAPAGKNTLPLTEQGTRALQPLTYQSPVASAQLKTAVLLAGVFAEGTTTVCEPAPSRNHTELMLPAFGVETVCKPGKAQVSGPQTLQAAKVRVPGDPSSSAFPACAAVLMPNSSITITNVSLNPGRIGYVKVLQAMGAQVELQPTGFEGQEPVGNIHARFSPNLRCCEVAAEDIASMVDEIPILALVAAFAAGETVFNGVSELRVKESDRLEAIIGGLEQLGVHAWSQGDDLHVAGQPGLRVPQGLTFDSQKDHRLAMTWAVAGMVGGATVNIKDFESVCISYPTFSRDLRSLVQ
ncbi:MAG: 3-phosphoshikimate 1-carboxyvinyltransferase [Coriobacteriia bacterium]|nr:3-phosphoshikimate 1-carboxyvinyltransferase [Coriobacteriia bacterium]